MRSIVFSAAATLVVLSACGMVGHDHSSMGSQALTFGSPGSESEVSRTVEVEALDSLRFDPSSVEVEDGETIKFVVTNSGRTEHEFVLGDVDYQRSHGGETDSMDHSGGNAVSLEAGETAELIWTFKKGGEVLFACHVNDHYPAGMHGSIEIQ